MRPIAVFDTNVLFSGMGGWRGTPYRCIELARAGAVQLVTCVEIVSELESRLRTKLGFSAARSMLVVADLLSVARVVPIEGTLRAVVGDQDDDKIIECAVVGGAEYVVTGDARHLLPMRQYGKVRIVTPSQFLEIVRGS